MGIAELFGGGSSVYERFTDRARKCFQYANQEAQRLNHDHMSTEHLLLGILKEGAGVAGNVLKILGMDLDTMRKEVEKVVQPGPDMITMGKLPQTERLKKAVQRAIEEADALNHNYVGTEHLLLGIIGDPESVACIVLKNLGVTIERTREEVKNLLGPQAKEQSAQNATSDLQQAVSRIIMELAKLDPKDWAAALIYAGLELMQARTKVTWTATITQ